MDQMKTSVLMSTYNGADYLEAQLISLLQQQDLDEVVIIDDCSTDKTVAIIKEFIEKNSLQKFWRLYINTKNKGWKCNFFEGIEKTSGDLIFFSDQDDIWAVNKIHVQKKVFENNDDIMVLASEEILYYGEKDKTIQLQLHMPAKLRLGRHCRNYRIGASGCTMGVRREFYDRVKQFHHDQWAHDEFFWQLGLLSNGLYFMEQPTVLHRIHGNNVSRAKSSFYDRVKGCKNSILSMEQAKAYLQKEGAERNKKAISMLLKRIALVKKRLALLVERKWIYIPILCFDRYHIYGRKRQIAGDFISALRTKNRDLL